MCTTHIVLAAALGISAAACLCQHATARFGPDPCQPPFFDDFPGGLPAGDGPTHAALGDLDGDLDLDIVVTNGFSDNLSIMLR